jgi:hypothetical protein
MDVIDIVKLIIVPIAIAITAHQYKILFELRQKVTEKLGDREVRTIIDDKLDVLREVDGSLSDRIDEIENDLIRINVKLDRILELLYRGGK